MSKYRVTIVSAYVGNQEMTKQFMDNMLDKIGPEDRIILVSAGNEDKIAWRYEAPHIHLWLDKNESFSNSMNAGIKLALQEEQEYICVLGNDGFPIHSNWIEQLIETQITENVAILCPEPSRPHISAYDHLKIETVNGISFYEMFPAICWFMPEHVVRTVGLFDEQFKLGCYEDNDYALRVRRWGGKIAVDHKVKLDHLLSQTFGKVDRPDLVMAENGRLFNKKWEGKQ